MQIRVTYKGKDYDLPDFGPADFVAFERQFKVSAAALQDQENTRFEWLCFLVYRGLRKLDVVPAVQGFDDDFLEGIDNLDFEGDEEEQDGADPSVPAAQRG